MSSFVPLCVASSDCGMCGTSQARNMLLLYLVYTSPVAPTLIDNKTEAAAALYRSFLSDFWSIWYNLVLTSAENKRLMDGLRVLHAMSASAESWAADSFSVRFDSSSLTFGCKCSSMLGKTEIAVVWLFPRT